MSETYDPAQRRIHELEQEQCEMRQALAKVEELTKELERSQRGFEVAKKASLHWEEEAKVYQQRAKHAEQGAAIAYDVRHAAQERADTSSRQVAEMGKVQEEMRRALAVAHAGAGLYADDGELQDSTRDPFIDWKRDPWNVIKDKLELRAVQVLEEGEQAP